MATVEQEAILKMVAAGTLSVEQGAELLGALDAHGTEPLAPPAAPPPGPGAVGGPSARPAARGLGGLIDDLLSRGLSAATGADFREPPAHRAPLPPRAPQPPRPPRPPRQPRPPRPPRPMASPTRAMPRGPARQGLSFEDLVEMKASGVPKDYVDEMRRVFPAAEACEIIECHSSGVDADYAAQMAAIFEELEPSELVEMHGNGVTVELAAALRLRYPDLESCEVVEAAAEGVLLDDLDEPDDLDDGVGGEPRPGEAGRRQQ